MKDGHLHALPTGVASRSIHRFEDYEATRNAAAAVWARYERGDLQIDVASGVFRVDGASEAPAADPPEIEAAPVTGVERQP
jgi:hypothetical protein